MISLAKHCLFVGCKNEWRNDEIKKENDIYEKNILHRWSKNIYRSNTQAVNT